MTTCDTQRCRLTLFLVAFAAGAMAIGILLFKARFRELPAATVTESIEGLLNIYLPLLAIMAGFYFAVRREAVDANACSRDTFLVALLLLGVWVLAGPAMLLLFPVEEAIGYLKSFGSVGSTLAAGAVAFFFSKTGQAHPETAYDGHGFEVATGGSAAAGRATPVAPLPPISRTTEQASTAASDPGEGREAV